MHHVVQTVVVHDAERLGLFRGAAAVSCALVYDLVGHGHQLTPHRRHVLGTTRPGAVVSVPRLRKNHKVPVDWAELDVEIVTAAVRRLQQFICADLSHVPGIQLALTPAFNHRVFFQRNLYVRSLYVCWILVLFDYFDTRHFLIIQKNHIWYNLKR